MSDWTKCKDDLPKREGNYIVATRNEAVCMAHYYPDARKFGGTVGRFVTHWMEKPLHPRLEVKQNDK